MQDTFRPGIKDANLAVRDWRKENRKNLTEDQRAKLNSSYNEQKSKYVECHSKALKAYAEAKIKKYESIISEYQKKTGTLSSKGLDVANLNMILNDAETNIFAPFREAVNSATNNEEIKKALEAYCMFNGCKNGINFHLAARFEVEKLTQIYIKVKARDDSSKVADELEKLKTYIDASSSTLAEAGDSQYKNGQGEKIWSNIRNAHSMIKEIRKILEPPRPEKEDKNE